MNLKQDDLLSLSLRSKLNNVGITLPFLFVTLNILNVLDKVLTWMALRNPVISELNPMARYVIERFGIMGAMALYMIMGFVIFCVVYKIVTMKRSLCEKHNVSPETFFLMLNVVFCFVVINNIFWLLYSLVK